MLLENKFDKKEYDKKYHKEHYKQFKAKLKKQDYDELNELLKEKNMKKPEFILLAKKNLESLGE